MTNPEKLREFRRGAERQGGIQFGPNMATVVRDDLLTLLDLIDAQAAMIYELQEGEPWVREGDDPEGRVEALWKSFGGTP